MTAHRLPVAALPEYAPVRGAGFDFHTYVSLRLVPVLGCLLVCLGTPVLQAQTVWNAGTGNWFTPGNWTPGVVPAAGTNVQINNGGTAQIGAAGAVGNVLTLGNAAGQSGTLDVTGAGTLTLSGSTQLLVGEFGTGTMTISAGGAVIAGVTSVGDNTNSIGTMTVTGSGSQLTANLDLEVGSSGNGTLNVLDGGLVTAGNVLQIGNDNGASGTVMLTGNTGILTKMAVGTVNIGAAVGGTGDVQISGANALFAAGAVNVGAFGHGSMSVTNGAAATTAGLKVGVRNSSGLTISSGGTVTSSSAALGINTGIIGDVTVTGAGSKWTITNALEIGQFNNSGSGTLNILNGGKVSAGTFNGYSTATVNVDGAGSNLTFTGTATFGSLAAGGAENLNVTNGGSLTLAQINLAQPGNVTAVVSGGSTVTTGSAALPNNYSVLMSINASGVSSLKLQDSGTTWTTLGGIQVGTGGTSTLTIESGAKLTTGWIELAENAGSSGTVTVQGTGSTLIGNDGVHSSYVGRQGQGVLNVLAGGKVQVGELDASGSFGTVGHGEILVSGTGSQLTTAELRVGIFGPAKLTVENGGRVDGTSIGTAENSGITGNQIIVTGGTLHASANIVAGLNGTASLTATAGAVLQSAQGFVGDLTNSTGTAILSGAGSSWTLTDTLTVGFLGHGTMTVDNGASISTTTLALGTSASGRGEMYIRNAGTSVSGTKLFVAGQFVNGGASTLVVADGASLNLSGAARIFAAGILQIGEGALAGQFSAASLRNDGQLHFNHTDNVIFNTPITGTGTLVKDGSGTVTLGGASTYTGATSVNTGTLVVNGSLGNTAVTVASGATLAGSGTITGDVTIASGGTLSPGNSPGTITLGSLVLNSASVLDFQLGLPSGVAGVDSDLINVTGALTLDGILNVTALSSYGTGMYRLINYGGLLTDNGLSFGTVPTGFAYGVDTSTANQVNLVVNSNSLQLWDGPNTTANNVVDGGTSIWNNALTNWTSTNGSTNAGWGGHTAIFSGTAGTVTLGDNIAFEGIQFMTDGYVINADSGNAFTLAPTGTAILRTDAGVTATINAPLTGAGGIQKVGTGTLVLTHANTYADGTQLNEGTLLANHNQALGSGLVTINGGTLGSGVNGTALGNDMMVKADFSVSPAVNGTLTFGGGIDLNGGARIITSVTNGSTLQLNGVISNGSVSWQATAARATIVYAGGSANAYNGLTTVGSNVVLSLNKGAANGAVLGNLTISAGGVTQLGAASQITDTAVVTVNGTGNFSLGALDLNGFDETIGTLMGSGPVQLNNGLLLDPGSATAAGILTVGTGDYSGAISDAGAGGKLVKTGPGTLILSGTSSYTGTTTITGGLLRVDGTLSAGGTVSVNSGGTLGGIGTIQRMVAVASGGAIAPGNGAGTLTIGNLVLNPGALLNYELGAPGGVNDLLQVMGSLTLDGQLNITALAGFGVGTYRIINYTGALTDNGLDLGTVPGGYIFTVDASVADQVNLIVTMGGTLAVAYWNGTHTTPNNVVNGGTGTWNTSTTNWTNAGGTVSGIWGGDTAVFKNAAGTVTLGGNIDFKRLVFLTNGYVINGAGFSLAPAGDAMIATAPGIVATISAPLTGTGGLTKTGGGTLNLTDTSTYTGDTHVDQGSLLVNGVLASPNVRVNQTGLLGGNGLLQGNVFSHGLVSPGNSPGTLHIGGSYLQYKDGALLIQIASRSQFDRLQIGGTARVGGTIAVLPYNGYRPHRGDRFPVLTARGGVSGTYQNVLSPFPQGPGSLLYLGVEYTGNAVIVAARQNTFQNALGIFGLTPNQKATAGALDNALLDKRQDRVLDFLDNLDIGKVPHQLDKIAPEELTSIYTLGFAHMDAEVLSLQQRFADIRQGATYFGQGDASPPQTKTGGKNAPDKQVSPVQLPNEDQWGFFITEGGDFANMGDTFNANGFNIQSASTLLGIDKRLNDRWVGGLALGYARTDIDLIDDGSLKADGGTAALYAMYHTEKGFYAEGMVGGGYNSYDIRRSGLEGPARGNADGGELDAYYSMGYDMKMGRVTVTPLASLLYTLVGINGFDETGSLEPLHLPSQTESSLRSRIGLRASCNFKAGTATITPAVSAQWQHEFLDDELAFKSRFANGSGDLFTVHGPKVGRDSALLTASLNVAWSRYACYLAYQADLGRQNYDNQTLLIGFRVSW